MAETIDVLEAARRMGITPDAVRARLRRGTLEGYRDNSGNWRIVSTDTTVSATTDTMPAAPRREVRSCQISVVSPKPIQETKIHDLLGTRRKYCDRLAAKPRIAL